MTSTSRRLLRPLVDTTTYRRWAFLVLGGALLVPYFLLANVLVILVDGLGDSPTTPAGWVAMAAGTLLALLATASVPAVRVVMGSGAKELLDGPLRTVTIGAARSWSTRWRTTAWLLAHVLIGGVVSVGSLLALTFAVTAVAAPFTGLDGVREVVPLSLPRGRPLLGLPVAGAVSLVALVYAAAGAGALLARLGPVLLGPSAHERLAAAEQRAAHLAERNRLARDLHDSVGHALSIVTMQAAAGSRVLDADPAFADRALRAIEAQARGALEDLDHVLGLLRDPTTTAPQPTLDDLDALLTTTRSADVAVTAEVTGDLARLPRALSRETYRIIQECLTNAVRHAGRVPVGIRLAVTERALELDVTNQLTRRAGGWRAGGGRGLDGIRERVALLRGEMSAAADDGSWRVRVRVPLEEA